MALPRHVAVATLLATVVALLAVIGGLAVSTATQPSPASETPVQGGLADVHEAGYTGENVSIGIVDVTGFDRSRAAITDQVAGTRAFGPGATVAQGGHSDHGTAAAAVAAETAPDADLYLAAFETQGGYERAVQWLQANDVDVVVAPVSFYGTPGDGSTRVSAVATDAVRQDVVFVAAAGNLANSHWRGRYDAVDDGALAVDGSRRNYLRGEGGHVTLWLSWDEAHADENYTVELYREADDEAGEGADERVATSRSFEGDSVPNERLEADVQGGRYYAVVRGPERATSARLRLTSPTHEFQRTTPEGSLAAPATADGALSVGAYDPVAGRVEPFSSRGPTLDGRLGVDVIAPARHDVTDGADAYDGTSAASAYTGGVVALLQEADPGRSPQSIEYTLEATAVDVGHPGPTPSTGYGHVHAARAVDALANTTG